MIRTIIMIVRAGQSITEHDKSGREIAVKIDTVGHINFTNGTERWRGLFVIRLPGLIQQLCMIYPAGILKVPGFQTVRFLFILKRLTQLRPTVFDFSHTDHLQAKFGKQTQPVE